MITSAGNSQIKNIIKLMKSAKARREQDCYLVEGIRMCREIPKKQIIQMYVSLSFHEKNAQKEPELLEHAEIVSDSVFSHMSETVTPQGILAIVKRTEYSLEKILEKEQNPMLILLENVQDPGNLGTIIRSAEGAGATAVIMSKDTVDIYNPKVIRSTMGSVFRVPFFYVEDLNAVVVSLQEKGIHVFSGDLKGNDFYLEDYREGSAFLIGNEGNGLTEEISALADKKIRIPMEGKVESLNASIAATILMYEALRQRKL